MRVELLVISVLASSRLSCKSLESWIRECSSCVLDELPSELLVVSVLDPLRRDFPELLIEAADG